MDKKKLLLAGIPITGVAAVANLLYFWLAPNVGCKLLVYGFCFGTLLIQFILSVALRHYSDVQKALPMVVSGSAFSLGVLVAGGMLLAFNAPVRTAFYFLLIFFVLYLICAGYLSCMVVHGLWQNTTENRSSPSLWERLKRVLREFNRHQPGETDAERRVRNSQQSSTYTPPQSPPPPLPEWQV